MTRTRRLVLFSIVPMMLMVAACTDQDFIYEATSSGLEFTLNGQTKRVTVFSDNTMRISVKPQDRAFHDSSFVVHDPPPAPAFDIVDGNELTLSTASLVLTIDKGTGAIAFTDANGNHYLREHESPPELQPTSVDGQQFYRIRQGFRLSDEEGIYGLGQFQNGYFNYRGRDLLLVQSNVDAVVPFLVSTSHFGILWDNESLTRFHDGAGGTWFESDLAEQIDYYFVGRDSMDEVISGYRQLTGRVPMFAKKAYGFWQSKERYRSFDELKNVVDRYRANRIPLDNIVQDWRYWGDDLADWNSMHFEPGNFPDPAGNIAALHEKNVDVMISIWPQMGPETELYKDLDAIGGLLSPVTWTTGKVYDVYNPAAREIYWDYIKKGLLDQGIDALWMDGTEPEFGGTSSQQKFLDNAADVAGTAMGPFHRYLNSYSLLTTEEIYQRHRQAFPDKRVFILTRSAWAGQQRNAAVTWSGDVYASFEVLHRQIVAGLNFSMAGIPYWTHDIGGFFPNDGAGLYARGIEDPAYRELYVRWFQFGAFTPIFRSHGTGTPRETWQFKEREPRFYDALVAATELRYRLLPYIYSTAWQVSARDYTMMRALVMDFPEDRETSSIGDQFLFGPALLVKPVTRAMYHRPEPLLPEIIPPSVLRTADGAPGLRVSYFAGTELEGEPIAGGVDENIEFNWSGGGTPAGVPQTDFSARWEGELVPRESGAHTIGALSDDGIRVWLDGELIIDDWSFHGPQVFEHPVELKAGRAYPIRVEYFQGGGGAALSLGWTTPSSAQVKEDKRDIDLNKEVEVYLPANTGWYDFWTNEFKEGGRTMRKASPIHILPLYVKAGSIIPMGPVQQYVGEKDAGLTEVRIYAGRDAEFVYYEDEGNNYNYEHDAWNTIRFTWDEDATRLTIGESTGTFAGHRRSKTFDVTLIRPASILTKTVTYTGQQMELAGWK